MATMPPPWIIFLLLVPLAVTDENVTLMTTEATTDTTDAEEANVTLTRMNRGTSQGTQFPTYYLARSYTDGTGERRNVLIPVQGTAATAVATAASPSQVPVYQEVSPAPNLHSPTQIYALSQDMLMTLHKAGLIPEPPAETTIQGTQPIPTQPSSNDYTVGSSVYTIQSTRLSTSSPQKLESLPVPAKLESPTAYTPTEVRYRPNSNLKSQVYLDNSLKSQAYLASKLKTPLTKLYNVNFRNRINTRPSKTKYTSTKLQFSLPTSPATAESPYTNKVHFELEDARIPVGHNLALQPISSTQLSPSESYTTASPTPSGLSRYLDDQQEKQFYVAQEGQQVAYVQFQVPQSVAPTRQQPTSQPHLHYVDSNNIVVPSPHPSARPTQSAPSTSPATLQQHYNERLTIGGENSENQPHVEYVKITDIEVAPRPLQSQKLVQPKPSRVPYHFGGSAQKGRYQHYHQHVPQQLSATPSQIQNLLKAQNYRINPRPQVTFASDSGLRSALTPPEPQRGPQIPFNIKPTVEPNIEFIQSNEVTFAPEIMDFDPAAVRQQNEQKAQYIQETNSVAPPSAQYVHETNSVAPPSAQYIQAPQLTEYIQETNSVAPPPAQNYQQYSSDTPRPTSNPNDPTPSIELEYTPGKFPPMVQEAYNILKHTSQLPAKITPDNIDGSIKTLGLILQRLQEYKQQPSGVHQPEIQPPQKYRAEPSHPSNAQIYTSSGGSTPGRPGIDYPTYHKIPKTKFDCSAQRYKGFFGDPETQCQVWHYCDLNGGQASFLCPNGTIFSQVGLTCDWWYNVKCATTSQLYVLNERLYKYILPFSPSFPEDYSGPGVDRYLTAKFEEQEAKNKVRSVTLTTTPRSTSESESVSTTTTKETPT